MTTDLTINEAWSKLNIKSNMTLGRTSNTCNRSHHACMHASSPTWLQFTIYIVIIVIIVIIITTILIIIIATIITIVSNTEVGAAVLLLHTVDLQLGSL